MAILPFQYRQIYFIILNLLYSFKKSHSSYFVYLVSNALSLWMFPFLLGFHLQPQKVEMILDVWVIEDYFQHDIYLGYVTISTY